MSAAGFEAALRRSGLTVARRRVKAEDVRRLARGFGPTLAQVIEAAAWRLGVPEARLVGVQRTRDIAIRRMVALAAARAATRASLPEIGRAFGGRDHTMVLHALGRVEGWLDGGGELAADVRDAIDAICARARAMAEGRL